MLPPFPEPDNVVVVSASEFRDKPPAGLKRLFGYADEMLQWIDHLGTVTTVTENGPNGRMVELEREGAVGPAAESFGYDLMGRRITDGLHDYLWSWRGELVEVEIISGESAGRWITYVYDASGRLLEREHWENRSDPHLRSRRGFLWNDWELIAEIGLNTDPADPEERVLWRVEYLPGPFGLDDSPQLAVTTHIHPDDPAPEQTRFFDLVRDEMGTVIAILEDVEPPISGTAIPPLKARILYDPYGQAHVEEGPELRTIEHDPNLTEIDGVAQAILDEGEPGNPVIGIAGGLVVTTSMALDGATLAAGVTLMRCNPGCVALGPAEVAMAQDDVDATSLHVMPVDGWLEGQSYRLVLSPDLTDAYGRALIVPGGGAGYTVPVAISADVEATDDPLPSLPREIPLIFDNIEASSAMLDCDGEPCFPGGLNLLFQGLWTDPVTGIAYARNRWYDGRTATWLSEDPKGAIDSPNLYAFVGWGPHVGRDPMGLHTYRTVDIGGVDYTILGPDPEEIAQGQYGMSISYTPTGRKKIASISISQHEGEMIALQAKLGNPLIAEAFEQFYGVSVDAIPDSIMKLEGRGVWHHKVDIAIATLAGFVMAGGRPQATSSPSTSAPRVNLANPRPSKPISEISEAWQGGRRVYRIPPGSSGGDTAYSRVSPEVRQRFFPEGQPRPVCSYCRTRPAYPVDHVEPKVGGGNLAPENTTPACTHCNPSKGARTAPKTPPPEYTGAWPPEWWPETMRTWWQGRFGGNPS